MKSGKVTDAILKRSVINLIDYKNKKVISGAGIGNDCSVIDVGEVYVLTSTQTALTGEALAPYYAVIKAANNVVACGGTPISASAAFVLPCKYDEKRLKNLTRSVLSACRSCDIQLSGGHTEVSENASCNLVTITITGTCKKEDYRSISDVKPGMDIVVSKWIGLEQTALLLSEKSEQLLMTLPSSYVSLAADFGHWCYVKEEAEIARSRKDVYMHDISDGGIFAALWDFSEKAKVGIEVNLKAIPIKQETVEFTEIFRINPYWMKSAGSLLMATNNATGLVEELKKNGIHSAIIGKTTDNNDKKIINGDEVRYLDKP